MFIKKCFSSYISNLQNARFVFMAGERMGAAPKMPDPNNSEEVKAQAEAGIQAAKEGIKTDIVGHEFDAKTVIDRRVTDINVIAGAAFNSFKGSEAFPLSGADREAKKAIEKTWKDALDEIKNNEQFYYGLEKYVDKKTEITVMFAKNTEQLLQAGELDPKKAQALFDASVGLDTSSKELLNNLLLSEALLATEYKADYDQLNVQIQTQRSQLDATANVFTNKKQQVVDEVGAANTGLASALDSKNFDTTTVGNFRTVIDQSLVLEGLLSQLQSAEITNPKLVQLKTNALTQKTAVDATLARMKDALASSPEAKTQFDKLLAARQNYLSATAALDKTQSEGIINERHTNAVIQATTWQEGADAAYKGLLEQMVITLPKAKDNKKEGTPEVQV